jgi:hypothetical protein
MNGNGFKKKKQTFVLWTYSQAQAAGPYLASILRSIRETWLEANQKRIRAERLAAKPGRPDRHGIIEEQQAQTDARRSLERHQEAKEELEALGIACIDANCGQAWIPFSHDNQLAWFVFDMFDQEPIQFWRYQTDPLETRRPLGEITVRPTGVSFTV